MMYQLRLIKTQLRLALLSNRAFLFKKAYNNSYARYKSKNQFTRI